MPPSLRFAGLLAVANLALSSGANGQAAIPMVRTPAAVADSMKGIDSLTAVVKADPTNVNAWLERGLRALQLVSLADRRMMPPDFDVRAMYRIAHESINHAHSLDPDNPQAYVALARLKGSAGGVQGPMPIDLQYEAFKRARTKQDSVDFARLALRVGTGEMVDYEFLAEKALGSFGPTGNEGFPAVLGGQPGMMGGQRGAPPPDYTMGDAGPTRTARSGAASDIPPVIEVTTVAAAAGNDVASSLPVLLYGARDSVLNTMAQLAFDVAGERNYLRADLWLERAHNANPSDQQVYLEYAKTLVTRNRWSELLGIAVNRIKRDPGDPWGWMARGLAEQRTRRTRDARVSFDSALARFSRAERDRLDRLDRVLRNGEVVQFRTSDAAQRERTANASWLLADPLWSNDEEDPRVEFLARVAFSDLRWTYGSVRGADSPRGDIYTRYGPPDTVIGNFWIYDSGLIFALSKGPVARNLDPGITAAIREWQPSRWDNIAESRIDSLGIQVARFRADADSVEVYIAIDSPLDSLRRRSGLATAVRTDFWLYGWTVPEAFHDSTMVTLEREKQWRYRVPAGSYYYRIEAHVPGAAVAARAAATTMLGRDTVTGFSTRGFGMSDLLLASTAEAAANAARWSDVSFKPLTGPLDTGAVLALVWETYDLAREGTDARYTVTVTMQRERSTGERIVANIANRLATLVGVERTDDRLTVTFDRTVPHAPFVADLLNVELGQTPPGSYRLTVDVTDRVSGQATSRVTQVLVRTR